LPAIEDGFEDEARETLMPAVKAHSPLDPQTLAKDATALVSAALMGQARALVVARQQDAALYIDDPVLAVRTRDSQEELRRDVDYYLNRAMLDVIGRLVDADSAATLFAALSSTLAATADQQSSVGLLGAVLAQFEQNHGAAAELADNLSATASRVTDRSTALEALLQQQIDALEGPEGEIQKTKDALAETTRAINSDLDDVVKAADAVGSGVKTWLLDKIKVVTGILSTFGGDGGEDGAGDSSGDSGGGGGSSADDTADGSGEDDSTDDGAKSGKAQAGGKSGGSGGKRFDVTGLDVDVDRSGDDGTGEASQGSADLGAAVASYRTHNATAADLYWSLARQNAGLAVAAAIGDQAGGLSSGLGSAAAAASALADGWQSLLDAAGPLREQTDSAQLAAELSAAVNGATARWSSLAAELAYARAALVGERGMIPDVGTLPTAAGR
jgi:hypothetical protein